ncbi:MAG: Rieske (2Fe-2S) protein [Rhizobiaceae bacterium]
MIPYPDAIKESWLPVAAVQEVGDKPLSRRLHGVPLAIFRARDGFGVLRDRCPHRNVALSEGKVIAGEVVCPYHGWSFGKDGACTGVPGSETVPRISANSLPVRVEAGLIFTSLSDNPRPFPAIPAPIGDAGYDQFLWPIRAPGFLVDAVRKPAGPGIRTICIPASYVRPTAGTLCVSRSSSGRIRSRRSITRRRGPRRGCRACSKASA